jgi:hypothetical protein
MTVKQLKNILEDLENDAEFVVSSDEELNTIFGKWEVAELEGEEVKTYCIYGFSGSEIQLSEED